MKRYINLLFLFSFLFFFTACRGDEEWSMTNSGFLISLGDEQTNITSRATPAEIGKPVADMFQLKITKKETNNIIYNGAYKSGVIQASTGNYTLSATCGDNPELAWDTPYYEGTTEAEVQADQTTSVTIPCKVANALLSIQFSNPEKYAILYSSYGVKVTVGSSSLNFENSDTKKSAYFRAGSKVTLTFHATIQETGKEVSMVIESESLPQIFAAGTHTKLSLTAATPTSGTILEVDKVEVEKVTITQTIPLEWLPKPKVTGFGGNTTLNYTETADAPSDAVISYTASAPVQEVEFTLDFKDAQYTEYNKTYTISKLTDEERTKLTNIGIKLPEIDGISKEGALDLSAFTAQLLTNNGTEVVNNVKFKVKANNRWSNEEGKDYQIKVVKPEFTVTVKLGNMWTKEFTVDEINASTGNTEKMKSRLVYLFSADGGITWQECNNIRQQVFSSIPANKSYKVKVCYRNCIYSNNVADVILETPTQIPNSDMETWYINTLSKTGKYYHYWPYSKDDTQNWWTTNNARAADPPVAAVNANSCPAVSYVNNGYNGRAAEIRTTAGSHYAHTNKAWIIPAAIYPEGIVSGTLFIGKYEWNNNDTEVITPSHEFNVRPTKMSFYYKYLPLNTDEFKAYIELQHKEEENNIVIASGEYTKTSSSSDSDFQKAEVSLNYKQDDLEATHIYIRFWSTTKTSFSKSDVQTDVSVNLTDANSDWKAHVGSRLQIDDISLIYDK